MDSRTAGDPERPGLVGLFRPHRQGAGHQRGARPVESGREDFAYFLEKIPGTYIQIGIGNTYSNHHPKFQLDPAALYPASEYLVRLAEAALDKLQKGQK